MAKDDNTYTAEEYKEFKATGRFPAKKQPKPETVINEDIYQMILKEDDKKPRKKPRQLERDLQIRCINWFRLTYPNYAMNLFSIPNGGSRNKIEAANMKRSGTTAGVSDCFLAIITKSPNGNIKHPGMFLEFKANGNCKVTDNQIKFEKVVKFQWYRYEVIYDFDLFKEVINEYLGK